ncbi:Uncharacterised protein [Legionella oakridgensis]|nr:hypothetical protein LLB_0928 [Legionella longbeachae D-4968]VEE01660.1 Uncharacterised protein [Legionella oakridgensis]
MEQIEFSTRPNGFALNLKNSQGMMESSCDAIFYNLINICQTLRYSRVLRELI